MDLRCAQKEMGRDHRKVVQVMCPNCVADTFPDYTEVISEGPDGTTGCTFAHSSAISLPCAFLGLFERPFAALESSKVELHGGQVHCTSSPALPGGGSAAATARCMQRSMTSSV